MEAWYKEHLEGDVCAAAASKEQQDELMEESDDEFPTGLGFMCV